MSVTDKLHHSAQPRRAPNRFFYVAGLGFMALAKAKYLLHGYSTPKPFDDVQRCIDYDLKIARNYMRHAEVRDKHVLELGPGADLGVGLYLLANGAKSYTAVDRNNLAGGPDASSFYERFISSAGAQGGPALYDEVKSALSGEPGRLRYLVRKDFQFSTAIPAKSIDLVLSNAAFEHFDDVKDVIAQISQVIRPGGKIVATIDLQTHSRWIREKDPNNIYRYSDSVYRAFYFPGQPNRVRPRLYREYFAANGWGDIETIPSATFDSAAFAVHPQFAGENNELDCLSFVLRATYLAGQRNQ
jgi:SAM-dependent methyltransferase